MLIRVPALPKRIHHGGAHTPWGDACLSWANDGTLLSLSFVTAPDNSAQSLWNHLWQGGPWQGLVKGTDFQWAVWQSLWALKTPATYGEIACKIGFPKAVRAVGTAVGKNPLAWLIPCHRVLPKTGGIGQYRWGAEIKEKILRHEHAYPQT